MGALVRCKAFPGSSEEDRMPTLTATRAARALGRRQPPDLAGCGSVLRRLAAIEGLTTPDIVQLLVDAPREERNAVQRLLDGGGDPPPDRRAAATGLARLEDLLDAPLGSSSMGGPWRALGRRLG